MEHLIINHWAVWLAAISDFFVGALWYSSLLFYKAWLRENKLSQEEAKSGNPLLIYGLTFILALIISYNLAFFLGDPKTTVLWGLAAGFLAGFGWAAMGLAIIGLFEKKSWKYILINSGYLVVAFSLKGLIIGAWR